MPGKPKGVVVATSAVVISALVGLALIFRSELVDLVLTSFSKDAGLTGRNILWNRAAVLIAGHPWFGTGYGAFWVQGHLEAEGLWRSLGIGNRAGFHFHNLYYNMLVEVGFVGLSIALVLMFGTAVMLVVWAVQEGSPTSAFFLACHLSFLIRSYAEVDFMVGFGSITFLVNCSWAFGYAYLAARRPNVRRRAVVQRGKMILNQAQGT